MKKMNNKGFSLVELIVVIAIMAVLVGVLAPQFIKYVESSRRSTDISNAQNIQSAILADIAEATMSGTVATATNLSSHMPSTLAEEPMIKGNVGTVGAGSEFKVTYNSSSGTCSVWAGTYELTTTSGAKDYKDAP